MKFRVLFIAALLMASAVAGYSQRPIPSGPTLPPTCTQNDLFIRTGFGLYVCLTTNNWSLSGGGGTAPAGVPGSVQVNNGGGALDADAAFTYDTFSNTAILGTSTLKGKLAFRGGTTSNLLLFQAGAPTGNYNYTFPNDLPSVNQYLGAASVTGSNVTLGWITPAGAVNWGAIGGTLSSQLDLQAALDAKVPITRTVNGQALSANVSITPATLGLVIGTNVQAWDADLDTWATKTPYAGSLAIVSAKTATINNTLTFSGTDGSTLNIGAGGTLGSAAFTASTAYEVPLTFSTGLTRTVNTVTVNAVQNITKLSNLTGNGLVTTSGGDGTLGITTPGTGVLTALGVNIGSAGAPLLFNGAGGTPSSITLTNGTGLPPTTGISGWPANAVGVLTNNGSGALSWGAASPSLAIGNAIGSGNANRVLFESSGNLLAEAAGFTFDGTSKLGLGVAGTSVGAIDFKNATSGTITLQAVTGALGTVTHTLLATTGNVALNTIDNSFTASQTVTQNLAANTSGDGLLLTNTRAASNGNQMYSPRIHWRGNSWNTTSSASQPIDYWAEVQPVQGTVASGYLVFSGQFNGGTIYKPLVISASTTGGSMWLPMLQAISGTNYVFTTDGANGLSLNAPQAGGNGLDFRLAGVVRTRLAINSSVVSFSMGSADEIGFSSAANPTGAPDAKIRRAAAANLAFGAADAASPVGQTESNQNVVAGTSNTAGATKTYIASLGTSQGAPGRQHFQGGAMIAASGTTQQTAIDRLVIGPTKVLTNNSAIAITNATVASNTVAGGVLDFLIEVFDGTDVQTEVGSVSYTVVNKGGVFSGNTVTKFGNSQTATSGTLSVTFAISAANPAVISVNANSSLTPSTGYPRITYLPRNLSQNAIAIQ